MARDVNDVVVLGFGEWSDVYGLPTLGFRIGGGVSGQLCFEAVEVHAGFAHAVEVRANIADDVQVSVVGSEATQVACG